MTTQNRARSALPERSILIAFLLFITAGGGGSVAIRMTYTELAPFGAAASRFILAALVPLVTIVVASTLAGEQITSNFLVGGCV